MADIVSTTRTFVLGTDNITYFEIVTTTYEDDAQDITKRPVGPVGQLTNDQADKMLDKFNTLANDSYRVSRTRKIIADVTTDDAGLFAITGLSALKAIQDRYQSQLTANGWTIDDGTGPLPIVFTVTGQGVLKYNINGTGTKNAKIYGAVIRLNSYPAAQTDTDFFLSENGKQYFSLPNRTVKIKKP